MAPNRLIKRIEALEESHEAQGIENGGIIFIWGEDDPDREIKEAKAKRLKKGVCTVVYATAEDRNLL